MGGVCSIQVLFWIFGICLTLQSPLEGYDIIVSVTMFVFICFRFSEPSKETDWSQEDAVCCETLTSVHYK